MEKAELASRVSAALKNDRVISPQEFDDILAAASVKQPGDFTSGGITSQEIIDARDLLKDAGTNLALAQAGYDQAGKNLADAKARWNLVDAMHAGGDRAAQEMVLSEAQASYNAYQTVASAFFDHASATARAGAEVNRGFKEHVAPIGTAVRDFFNQF